LRSDSGGISELNCKEKGEKEAKSCICGKSRLALRGSRFASGFPLANLQCGGRATALQGVDRAEA
jgi:hypothetical protein